MAPNGWTVEQALTRAVNDALATGCRRAFERVGVFLCECGNLACLDRCELSIVEYDRLRAHAGQLVVASQHAAAA